MEKPGWRRRRAAALPRRGWRCESLVKGIRQTKPLFKDPRQTESLILLPAATTRVIGDQRASTSMVREPLQETTVKSAATRRNQTERTVTKVCPLHLSETLYKEHPISRILLLGILDSTSTGSDNFLDFAVSKAIPQDLSIDLRGGNWKVARVAAL